MKYIFLSPPPPEYNRVENCSRETSVIWDIVFFFVGKFENGWTRETPLYCNVPYIVNKHNDKCFTIVKTIDSVIHLKPAVCTRLMWFFYNGSSDILVCTETRIQHQFTDRTLTKGFRIWKCLNFIKQCMWGGEIDNILYIYIYMINIKTIVNKSAFFIFSVMGVGHLPPEVAYYWGGGVGGFYPLPHRECLKTSHFKHANNIIVAG